MNPRKRTAGRPRRASSAGREHLGASNRTSASTWVPTTFPTLPGSWAPAGPSSTTSAPEPWGKAQSPAPRMTMGPMPGMGAIVGAAATGAAQTTVSTAVSQEPVKNNFGLDGNVGILRDVVHRTRNGGFILRAIVSSDARADTGDRGGTPDG